MGFPSSRLFASFSDPPEEGAICLSLFGVFWFEFVDAFVLWMVSGHYVSVWCAFLIDCGGIFCWFGCVLYLVVVRMVCWFWCALWVGCDLFACKSRYLDF